MPRDGRPPGPPRDRPLADTVDPERAREYAWRWAGLTADAPALPPPAALDEDDDTIEELVLEAEAPDERGPLQQSRREAALACQRLEVAIERTLAIEDPSLQARSTASLTVEAADLGPQLLALEAGPSAGLLRLIARHRTYESRGAREATRGILLWLELSHPEVARILLEVARAGDRVLADELAVALSFRSEHPLRPAAGVGHQLADLLDSGATRVQRLIALQWLELGCFPEATQALRRALRQPDLVMRWRALHALERTARYRRPLGPPRPLLEVDDVQFLLDDAVLHPLPPLQGGSSAWELDEAICDYGQRLQQATVELPPPGGPLALLKIIEGQAVSDDLPRRMLDRSWALNVLAAAYPEQATVHLDRLARHAQESMRLWVAGAVGRLPDPLSRPRLLRLAIDGSAAVATAARDAWLERFRSHCPVEPADELDGEMLGGPPTPLTASRLITLRGPAEGLPGMAEVLLGEAPDRQSLGLLLVILGNDALLRPGSRRGLPGSAEDWALALLRRFGEAGFQGLLHLARRYPIEGPGWSAALLSVLRDPARRSLLDTPERRAAIGDLAATLLTEHGAASDRHSLLGLLELTGTPPALVEPLIGWLDDPLLDFPVAMALAHCPADAALDARLVKRLQLARRRSEWALVGSLAHAVVERHIEEGLEILEALLAAADQLPDEAAVEDALEQAVISLRQAGRLEEPALLDWLNEPDSRRFALAAGQLVELSGRRTARLLARLEPVIGSPQREGASSAAAATLLLGLNAASARQRRWTGVAAAAPPLARALLIHELLVRKAPRRPLFPLLTELLTLPAAQISLWTRASLLFFIRDRAYQSALRALLPRVQDADLKESLRMQLGLPHPSRAFWQHGPGSRSGRKRPFRSIRRRRGSAPPSASRRSRARR